jgi:hypothetical protein
MGTGFAVTLRARSNSPDGVLMILDEEQEADEIALELRLKGHDVAVRKLWGPRTA